jgi:uncharacterized MnhB-related membrane protein
MSVETDLHALLAGHAPLAALVAGRVAQNAVPAGGVYPLVVYTAAHAPDIALNGALLGDEVTLQIQCWADDPAEADQVADAVITALAGAPAAALVTVTARTTMFDPDLELDCTQLAVEWWA